MIQAIEILLIQVTKHLIKIGILLYQTNIGRVHCGIQGSLNTNPIMCYGRWGSGANDYVTVNVVNP